MKIKAAMIKSNHIYKHNWKLNVVLRVRKEKDKLNIAEGKEEKVKWENTIPGKLKISMYEVTKCSA